LRVFTLAFALQLRKKHGKTTVRVRETSVRLIKTSVRVSKQSVVVLKGVFGGKGDGVTGQWRELQSEGL
jgi:hypothetical protein